MIQQIFHNTAKIAGSIVKQSLIEWHIVENCRATMITSLFLFGSPLG